MSIDPAILDALLAAGATAEMIVAAVKADAAKDAACRAERRQKDAARKRRSRAASEMSRGQPVTDADSRGQYVTARDPSPSDVSPHTPLPTNPIQDPPSPPKGGSSPAKTRADQPDDGVQGAVEAYNAAAGRTGWPRAQIVSQKRRSSLRQRLAEAGGVDGWAAAIERAERSAFLTGDNDRGWLPDIDFFLQQKSFTRLMEGAYDRRTARHHAGNQPHRSRSADIHAALDRAYGLDGVPVYPAGSPAGEAGPFSGPAGGHEGLCGTIEGELVAGSAGGHGAGHPQRVVRFPGGGRL